MSALASLPAPLRPRQSMREEVAAGLRPPITTRGAPGGSAFAWLATRRR